jgi:hypothetical protein
VRESGHRFYVSFLLIVGMVAAIAIGLHGNSYYFTPLQEQPFHPQYDELKPTGPAGHGYGVVGSVMITCGVALYSSRKRLRVLAGMGRVKHFLEFHIFLCLLGPVLVVYHTTFKFGGLVAVSFWSMTAVVLSGIIGRYFYTQIPKGIQGNELTVKELNAENENLAKQMILKFGLPLEVIRKIDRIALPSKPVAHMSLLEVIEFFVMNDVTRRGKLQTIFAGISREAANPVLVRRLRTIASRRIALSRRIAFLEKFKRIFYYWHVVHLPFSIVMFVILFVHVGVAIAFGYRWLW